MLSLPLPLPLPLSTLSLLPSSLPLPLLLPLTTETCLKVEEIKGALNKAREAGIQNILALRGDPAKGSCHVHPSPYCSFFPCGVAHEGKRTDKGDSNNVRGAIASEENRCWGGSIM